MERKSVAGAKLPEGLVSEVLKGKQRRLRDGFANDFSLRVHRAISWLKGAEAAVGRGDLDTAYICYWIAFNAAYARHATFHQHVAEREFFKRYFDLICSLDRQSVVYNAIWRRFSQSIRTFLDNHFVFAPFWRHQHGEAGFEDWPRWFGGERHQIGKALSSQDTAKVLTVLFDRLYVLRNQLMHGGATWQGSVNREQVRDGVDILSFLVPHFVDLMMDNPACDWGRPPYPVVDD